MRNFLFATIYGFVAGIAAALVLWLMGGVTNLVWSGSESRWYIVGVVMTGGVLLAILRHFHNGAALAEQIADLRKPGADLHRRALLMAAMAVVAVGFGGAVGPEAGILAVVGEISVVISWRLALNDADSRLLAETGTAGALGGLYGSPPGGAVIAQENPEAPKWQLYLAAIMGLVGFLLTADLFLPENPLRVHLPYYEAAEDGTDMLRSVIPAILGAGAGLFFVLVLPRIKALLARLGDIRLQTLVGSALFAALATAFPILRFSGHHELEIMLNWGQEAGMGALIALAAMKMLAVALCLASGWRGGAAFPLLFAGAAAGGAALWIFPGTPVTVALVAGIAAAMTAGMGKPIAAMLIALILIGPIAIWPLCVGALVGWGFSKLAPAQELH